MDGETDECFYIGTSCARVNTGQQRAAEVLGSTPKGQPRIDARARFKMYKLRAEGPPKKWGGAGRVCTFNETRTKW